MLLLLLWGAELAEQGGSYTKTVAIVAVVLAGLGALFYVTSRDASAPALSQVEQIEELEVREEVREKLLQNK